MNSYRLSAAADADIAAIGRESVLRWGLERAETYLIALHHVLDHLDVDDEFFEGGGEPALLPAGGVVDEIAVAEHGPP